jgi:hypothetical protein
VEFWRRIGASEWLLDLIGNGVKIPFEKVPPPLNLRNNKSVLDQENVQWVRDTLNEYLGFGFVEIVDFKPYCILPLQVTRYR